MSVATQRHGDAGGWDRQPSYKAPPHRTSPPRPYVSEVHKQPPGVRAKEPPQHFSAFDEGLASGSKVLPPRPDVAPLDPRYYSGSPRSGPGTPRTGSPPHTPRSHSPHSPASQPLVKSPSSAHRISPPSVLRMPGRSPSRSSPPRSPPRSPSVSPGRVPSPAGSVVALPACSFQETLCGPYRMRPEQVRDLSVAACIPPASWRLAYGGVGLREGRSAPPDPRALRGMCPAFVVLETEDGEVLGGVHTDDLVTSYLFATSTYRHPRVFYKRRHSHGSDDPFALPISFGATDLLIDPTNACVSSKMTTYHETGHQGESLLLLGANAKAGLLQLHIFWGIRAEEVACVALAAVAAAECVGWRLVGAGGGPYVQEEQYVYSHRVEAVHSQPAHGECSATATQTDLDVSRQSLSYEEVARTPSIASSYPRHRPGYVMSVERRSYLTAHPSRTTRKPGLPREARRSGSRSRSARTPSQGVPRQRRAGCSTTPRRHRSTTPAGRSRATSQSSALSLGYMSPAGVAWSTSGTWEKGLCEGRGARPTRRAGSVRPQHMPPDVPPRERPRWREQLDEALPKPLCHHCPITGLTYLDASGFERRREAVDRAMRDIGCSPDLLLYNQFHEEDGGLCGEMSAERCSQEWLRLVLAWAEADHGVKYSEAVGEHWRDTLERDVMWEGHIIAPTSVEAAEGDAEVFDSHFARHHPARPEGSVSVHRGCSAGCIRMSSPHHTPSRSPSRRRGSSPSACSVSPHRLYSYNPSNALE